MDDKSPTRKQPFAYIRVPNNVMEAVEAEAKPDRRSGTLMVEILLTEALAARGVEVKPDAETAA